MNRSITERPITFEEMVGQETILNEFKKRSKKIDFPNYMLFVGESGSGKSTCAFIISKLLNCANPVLNNKGYYEPCNKCFSCTDVISDKFRRDIYYMDASKMGKEEVVNLESTLSIMSIHDNKNKIIIIDEAHLLNSPAARSAMLLLSERNKNNIYLILCTTDNTKFDKALNSRFTTYQFQKLKYVNIAEYLYNIIKKEEIKVPEEFISKGLFLISENSEGSLRQALQYFDRCIYGEIFKEEDIIKEFEFIDVKKAYTVVDNLLNKDKSFFNNLNTIDMEKFFHYSKVILMKTYEYKFNPDMKEDDWKINNYKKMLHNPNFSTLIDTYLDFIISTAKDGYFNKNIYMLFIYKYFEDENSEVPILTKKVDTVTINVTPTNTRQRIKA
jgi:DNA polymerase-3 subunit gamma/tau